jgi:hypothetical protein
MSWDIHVQDLPREAKCVAEIPADFRPGVIGKRQEIIDSIVTLLPSASFSDPSWGIIDGEGWSIEVNLGSDEECRGFGLHVRGGQVAAGVVAAILQKLKLRALDSQTGEFFVPGSEAVESFRRWRAFRDHVVGKGQ